MVVTVLCTVAVVLLVIAFVLIARAEAHMYEEQRKRGKPTPWL